MLNWAIICLLYNGYDLMLVNSASARVMLWCLSVNVLLRLIDYLMGRYHSRDKNSISKPQVHTLCGVWSLFKGISSFCHLLQSCLTFLYCGRCLTFFLLMRCKQTVSRAVRFQKGHENYLLWCFYKPEVIW